MTNNLKEEIAELVRNIAHIGYVGGFNQVAEYAKVAPYTAVQPITTEEAEKRILTLINQKEKESSIKELERIKDVDIPVGLVIKPCGDCLGTYEYLEDRIKQLREELNKEVL